ncbi:MAG: aminotransferase class V-fold PLP-dependent enzyme [Bacteroidetes bacterium]|nr:MAG: aminotransferase class V-fold PLP-dependent enzyme [Bacteroidota bacterium]
MAYSVHYIINHLGEENKGDYFRAVAPPIIQTSNFAFSTVQQLRESFENEYSTWLYSRGLNPTVEILRKKLAALDEAEDCLVVNSGAAAIYMSILSQVKQGDHVIAVHGVYSWAHQIITQILPQLGITHTFVDGSSVQNFMAALQPNTTVVYLESPTSWLYHTQPLAAIAAWAKQHQIITICDNSFCTPLGQKPIALGIDIAIQSATKFISGHSDVVAGVISSSKAIIEKMFHQQYMSIGSGIQPFNAWLLLRGLRTMPLRWQQVHQTAKVVSEYVAKHPMVRQLWCVWQTPFDAENGVEVSTASCGGLLTFSLQVSNAQRVEDFCNALQHIQMAVSWGGYESLLIPKCATMPLHMVDVHNPEHTSCRLYVGLETAEFIISDLEQAFQKIQ